MATKIKVGKKLAEKKVEEAETKLPEDAALVPAIAIDGDKITKQLIALRAIKILLVDMVYNNHILSRNEYDTFAWATRIVTREMGDSQFSQSSTIKDVLVNIYSFMESRQVQNIDVIFGKLRSYMLVTDKVWLQICGKSAAATNHASDDPVDGERISVEEAAKDAVAKIKLGEPGKGGKRFKRDPTLKGTFINRIDTMICGLRNSGKDEKAVAIFAKAYTAEYNKLFGTNFAAHVSRRNKRRH
jgi:hypothetical protein